MVCVCVYVCAHVCVRVYNTCTHMYTCHIYCVGREKLYETDDFPEKELCALVASKV